MPITVQAVCFREAGEAWVPAKPWVPGVPGRWARGDATDLPEAARQHLARLEATASRAGSKNLEDSG